jgi:hypothetical protein
MILIFPDTSEETCFIKIIHDEFYLICNMIAGRFDGSLSKCTECRVKDTIFCKMQFKY